MRATLPIVFFGLMLTPAMADDTPRDTVIEGLQGRWEIVGGKNQGRELLSREVAGTYVTITTNSLVTYDHSQKEKFRAVFTIDTSRKPLHINVTTVPKAAPVKVETSPAAKQRTQNATALGILKFDGSDRWTLCYGLPGAKRPVKFESPPGSGVMLFNVKKEPVNRSILEEIRTE